MQQIQNKHSTQKNTKQRQHGNKKEQYWSLRYSKETNPNIYTSILTIQAVIKKLLLLVLEVEL